MSGQTRVRGRESTSASTDGPPVKKRAVYRKTVERWVVENDCELNTFVVEVRHGRSQSRVPYSGVLSSPSSGRSLLVCIAFALPSLRGRPVSELLHLKNMQQQIHVCMHEQSSGAVQETACQ